MKFDILSLSPQAVIFVCVVNTNSLLFLFQFLLFFFFCVNEEEVYSPEHSCIGTVKCKAHSSALLASTFAYKEFGLTESCLPKPSQR